MTDRRPPTVLTAGFVALDAVLTNDQATHRAGGTAGNVAANLGFLGWNAQVLARVGADPAGRAVVDDLLAADVNTEALTLDAAVATPFVVHRVASGRDHRFHFKCP